ncbi:MAG: 50S ribosomal protein L22 [Candidatus Paceibacterota bacterium]
MIKASLKNHRIAPRKVRVVADMIRGKGAIEASRILVHAERKARGPLGTLLDSAIANAKNNFQIEADSLFVKEIRVDQGYVLKRSMPVSRGSAHPIRKRTSHVSIVLAPVEINSKVKAQKSK